MTTSPQALATHQVSKTYTQGAVHALDQVSLSIAPGDFFGLLGPNGAGKTTFISIVTNLLLKDGGTVKICGWDLDKQPHLAKRALGVVPQEFNGAIFEKVENILYNAAGYHGLTRGAVKDRMESVLRRLGLWEKRHAQARTLSGGMKRRLMIARALIHDPKILILDEPTAGVDVELRKDMWQYLCDLNKQGLTILLTTHYLEEAEELCNRLAIINKGAIIKEGRTSELLRDIQLRSIILDLGATPSAALLTALAAYAPVVQDDSNLVLTLRSHQQASAVFAICAEHHTPILDVRQKANRLEELFLHLIQPK